MVVYNSAPDNIVIYQLFSDFSTNMLACFCFFQEMLSAVHACLVHLHVGLVWNQCCGCSNQPFSITVQHNTTPEIIKVSRL